MLCEHVLRSAFGEVGNAPEDIKQMLRDNGQMVTGTVIRQELEAAAPASAAPCFLDTQWLGYWGEHPSGIACGDPSEALVTLACIHEHVDQARICSGCAVDMQQAKGFITCKQCWDGAERHSCYMAVVITWNSGEKTIVQEGDRG
jgi:hypothetical protein